MTEEQVKYELRIRGLNVDELETSGPLAEQLQAILDNEVATQKDPLEWELAATSDQKDQELTVCVNIIRELRTQSEAHELDDTLTWDNFVISRLVHTDYRLKRIQYEGTSEDTRIASKKLTVASQWLSQLFTQVDSVAQSEQGAAANASPANENPIDHIDLDESNVGAPQRTVGSDVRPPAGPPADTHWSPARTCRSSEYYVRQSTPPHPTTAQGAAVWARAQDARLVITQLAHVEEELKREFKRSELRMEITNSLMHRLKLASDQITEIRRKMTASEDETSRVLDDAIDKWEQLDSWAVSKIVGNNTQSKATASSTLRDGTQGKKNTIAPFNTGIDEIGFDTPIDSARSRRNPTPNPAPKCVTFGEASEIEYPHRDTAKPTAEEGETRPVNEQLWPPRDDTESIVVEEEDTGSNWSHRTWGHGGSTPWQQQMQALTKAMGHRRFDGENKDQKLLSVNEFIGLVRMYQRSARISERILLGALPTQMTGLAFQWWTTVGPRITTVDQFEREVRMRFEHREMDKISQIVHVTARKQSTQERLPDYVDDMCQLAYNLSARMTEHQLIKLIIKNANHVCRQLLVVHTYHTIEELRNYVNYLGSNGLLPMISIEKKPEAKPKWVRPKYVNATETVGRDNSSASEDEAKGDEKTAWAGEEPSDIAAKIVAAVAKAFDNKKFDQNKRSNHSKEEAKKAETKPANAPTSFTAEQMMTEVRCYGCNEPGVFRRDCIKCNPHLAKNDQADL